MKKATIVLGRSVRARNLTVMLFIAPVAAESKRISRFASSRSLPGRMITSTPTKPSTTTPAAETDDLVEDEDGCQGRKERAGKGDGGRRRQRHHGDPVKPGRHR